MKLHYRKVGESGQPLIILHGLFGTSDNWQTHAKLFAQDHVVYLVDQRNHGHSPHTDEMNYYAMADDLKEIFDSEKITDAILMGHSMGGKTAMFFAQEHARLLNKLIVVDMGIKKYPPHHQLIFEALMAVDLDKVKTRKEVENSVSSYFQDQTVIQFLLKNLYWTDREQLAWRMNLQVLYRDIENILAAIPHKKVDVPTLFLRGGKSNYVLDEDWDNIREHFPNARLETIEKAGHWVHAEVPKEFYDAVHAFIGKQ
ncbi:MAG TPA: alpha/beta fold hydrolase [Flavobacteriales bacterium]|nr:alpha/beta fold hydrolase [Flavobacteriales bacterium]